MPASLVTFIINGKVYLALGLTAGLFIIVGNYMGAGYFTKSGVKIARPVIITVLTVFFARIIFELL